MHLQTCQYRYVYAKNGPVTLDPVAYWGPLSIDKSLEHPRILGAMQSAAAHHRGPQNAGILEVLVVFRGPPAYTG